MALSQQELVQLYRKRSKWYNFSANLYYLLGFREWAYRKKAVAALNLHAGATVVEVGCGTGLNFAMLQQAVGADGKVIGVDLTAAMLVRARERIEHNKWTNVELVCCDAAEYDFPDGVDGILSTFALTLSPEYDAVIGRGARALGSSGRFVIADLKMPTGWSRVLFPILLPLFRPFGVTRDLVDRHPWESLQEHFAESTMQELYFGYTYIATGVKQNQRGQTDGG